VTCKDGHGGPAERFSPEAKCRLQCQLFRPKRRGAGIGGVIPRPVESLPRAPVPAVPLPCAPGRLCPRLNAYVSARRSRQNSCAALLSPSFVVVCRTFAAVSRKLHYIFVTAEALPVHLLCKQGVAGSIPATSTKSLLADCPPPPRRHL
jgi:hypothetical protein